MEKRFGKWGAILIFFIIAHTAIGQEDDNEEIILDSADFLQNHAVFINTAFCNETKMEGTIIGSLDLPSGSFLALRDNGDTILIRVDCIVTMRIIDPIPWRNPPSGCVSYKTYICDIPRISGLLLGHIGYGGETFYVLKSRPLSQVVLVSQRYVINIGDCPDA